MADIYEWVGGRIRQVRRRAGLTQAELGERAGITPDYVGRIERGRGAATLETLGRIASALDVPLRELLDREEIASASREQLLRLIQAVLKKKDAEQLRTIYAVLEALE